MALAGTKTQGIVVYIGTTATDGSSDTYTQVKRVKNVGGLGPEAQVIDATTLEDSAKQKLKGIPDNGDVEISGNRVFTDAGQNALEDAAQDTDDEPYNVRIEVPGAASGGDDVRYSFKALVTTFRTQPGQVDGLIEFTSTIAITGAVTETAV